ncbi:carboxymuconolactone decarboxylase family protein [Streptomyces sp. NPDC093225]|uniref:carboxymuconolactone decarboxylase family protein n=1 Tax=Streptomyces sp. NPDC093225 TaxID=3366034 RepID=UPI003814A33A
MTTNTLQTQTAATTTTTPSPEFPAQTRLDLARTATKVYRAQIAFDAAIREGLEPSLVELVQIRASQLNGCAYCLHMHTSDAAKAGESQERLHMVGLWREAEHFFTEEERAALALAEAVTLIADAGVPDAVYAHAVEVLGEERTAKVIGAVCSINTWNRFAIATGKVAGTDERKR